MLKRISLEDVELGMFIHKLEGSWFKHPFWKSRFLLDDNDMLTTLQSSELDGVVIDTTKGLDLREMPRRAGAKPASAVSVQPSRPQGRAPASARSGRPAVPAVPQADLRSTAPMTMAREFGLANTVAGKSRKVISRVFLEARLGKTVNASQVEPLVEDIFSSIQRNPHAFNGLMRCKRDNEYVYRHALAVCALMVSLARQMKYAPQQIREAGMAGLLMDVGIGHLPVDLGVYGGDYRNLPEDILRQHVMLGYQFLQAGGGLPQGVLNVSLRHHETLDGTGYPAGIAPGEVDELSRMAAICDTYDSMVSDTADGSGMNPASAIEQMSFMKGWFDDRIMHHFIETMGIYPIGSVVRLRSGRLAMVVDQDPADPACPKVRTFYSTETRQVVRPETIALSQCYGKDAIIGLADPDVYGIADFPRIRQRLFEAAGR